MQASNNKEKEDWIGAFGRAMIKKTVLIDDEDMEDRYMWERDETIQMCKQSE